MSRARTALVAAAVVAPMALQVLALLNPDVVIIDCEERYNAGHALALLRHPAALLRLQYRDFCGGCTFVSMLGALPLALSPVFAAWKLVAIGFTGLLGGAGAALLDRRAGRAAAVAFALLVALLPWNYLRLALLSWGNHVEAGVLGVAMLALLSGDGPRRRVAAGLVGGLGLWVGFSMAPLVAGGLAILALRRAWSDVPWFLAGLLLAPALWLAQWLAAGTTAFGTIYIPGEATPDPLRLPRKLVTLLAPQQVAGVWGLPDVRWGVPLGYAWVASGVVAGVVALRQGGVAREAAVVACAWIAAYHVVGFQLEMPRWPDVAAPPGLRYAAPLYPFAFLTVAAVAGGLWTRGRPGWAAVLLAGPLASGLAARAAALTAPFPDAFAWRLRAADLPYFRFQASYLLTGEEHAACGVAEPGLAGVHAYAQGRRDARARLEAREPVGDLRPPGDRPPEPYFAGVGGQAIDILDNLSIGATSLLGLTATQLAALPEDARAAALEEVLWRRVWREKAWSVGRGAITDAGVDTMKTRVRALPADTRPAALRAWGRRWAREQARTAEPTPLALPAGAPPDFVAGIGDGLGSEWGPRAAVPRPVGLRAADEAAFLDGYRRGVGRHWLGDGATRLDEGAWPDLDADRWWGPPTGLLCPCGSTCE